MKILVYGDNSPASGGWCYAETLRDMGHDVLSVGGNIGLDHYQTSFALRAYRRLTGGLREADRRRHVKLLVGEVGMFQPNVIIVQKGLYISKDDVRVLRGADRWVCNVNHDDFFSANRNNWSWIQRKAIPEYDFIFTTREVNIAEVRPLNPRVEFFPFAYYPRIHHPVAIPPDEKSRWQCEVVFVGTYEKPRAAMLEHLVQITNVDLVIHGAQWEKLPRTSPLRCCVRSKDLRFDDLAKAMGGALVALGFLRKENRDDYTQRTFEVPACAGVFLAERTERHMKYYRDGIEAEFFDPDSPTDLCEKVARLLQNSDYREQMRKAGHKAVLRGHHTYRDRLERLIQVFEETTHIRKHR